MDIVKDKYSLSELEKDLVKNIEVRTVARFCTDPIISSDADLGEVFSAYALGRGSQRYTVETNGRFAGILTAKIFDDVDREEWSQTKVNQVMTPADEVLTVVPEAELKEAIDLINQSESHRVYVIQDDQLLGVIERDDIIEFVEFQATTQA
jgi:CBS domain-containing protein